MYPFWESVIKPLVMASDANRIVEIGALRGETTALMLDDLGPRAELHVIDPLPQFDPSEHEERFEGRYVFHRDLSLNVLGDIPACDVALIDGDHNWYTVYNELRLLREAADAAGRPMPMCVLHDVGWPYGRRDLYYDPSNIPEEHRQPYDRRGMALGRTDLVRRGGMNPGLANALEEGGPRNGVRTGLDDFVAEHPRPLRQVVLPIYFGLAIVAEDEFLASRPDVVAILDHLESETGSKELLALAENIRLEEVVFEHNIGRMHNERFDRATRRYLDLLADALLDLHYIENEERIAYLLNCATKATRPNADHLRAPAQLRGPQMRERHRSREHGTAPGSEPDGDYAYASMGKVHLQHLDELLQVVHADEVPGDLVEVGGGRGGGAIYMRGFLEALEVEDRSVWSIDRFRADPADVNQVRSGFERFGLLDDRVRFVQGTVETALADEDLGTVAVLRIGAGVGDGAVDALDAFHDRLADGAVVIVEDATDADGRLAEFRQARGIERVSRIGATGLAWRCAASAEGPSSSRPAVPAGPAQDSVDLSVVVVLYNMRREAERTLHSLSRQYQRDVDDVSYEVVVVDNGSDESERLTADEVAAFGPEFRLVEMGDDATSTPVTALNRGIECSRGHYVGLMIDGAHVLSPGVVKFAMAGLRGSPESIVATQHWYIGPGQQPEAVSLGYDEEEEDRLFAGIEWPRDGYRLFEISHFIGERDWLDGLLESNLLIVPRTVLDQVGGFDDAFDMPGGGFANLELYERLGSHPDLDIITLIGECTFHQVHGGTTTNDGDPAQRRRKTASYAEHYRELRGRGLQGPAKNVQYVGSFTKQESRRTRARRLHSLSFGQAEGDPAVGVPTTPELIPEELSRSFRDAFWRSLSWKDTTWLGEPVEAAPTDLMIYQELVASIRPDHVIVWEEDGAGVGTYLASICRMLGHGVVVSVGSGLEDAAATPDSRHHLVQGTAADADTVRRLETIIGPPESANALVILRCYGPPEPIATAFRRLAPSVPTGSYVVIENTIVNGRPVWPEHGPGPLEAVNRVLMSHGDFMQDTKLERFGLTFNPGGFLRRIEPADAE